MWALQVQAEHEENEWGIEVEPAQAETGPAAALQELPRGLQYSLPVRRVLPVQAVHESQLDGHRQGNSSKAEACIG